MGVVRREESNVEGIVLQLLVSGELENSIMLHGQAKGTLHVCQSRLYRLWKGWPSLLGFDNPLLQRQRYYYQRRFLGLPVTASYWAIGQVMYPGFSSHICYLQNVNICT